MMHIISSTISYQPTQWFKLEKWTY